MEDCHRKMQCLRCGSELKHYPLRTRVEYVESHEAPNLLLPNSQTLHVIRSVYVCDKCGWVEFSMRDCESHNG